MKVSPSRQWKRCPRCRFQHCGFTSNQCRNCGAKLLPEPSPKLESSDPVTQDPETEPTE